MATLPDLSALPVIAGIIASTVFATYAVISLIMRPYESPQYVTAKMKSTVNHRYIQSRRLLAVVYIALAIAGWFVVPPLVTASADDRLPFVCLVCVSLFFALHAEVLVGLCLPDRVVWRKRILWFVPLAVMCGVCLAWPQTATPLAYIQLCLLLLLIGYYTPAFFKEYADLTFFCGEDMCNGDPEDDFLPESLPWISRLYVALLLLAVGSAVGCFAPRVWYAWLLFALYIAYVVWFINRVVSTYTVYSKKIKQMMG